MVKIFNIAAWVAASAIIITAILQIGSVRDSRMDVIVVDDSTESSPNFNNDDQRQTLSEAIGDTGESYQANPDYNDGNGESDNNPASIFNDSAALALSQGFPKKALKYLEQALEIDSEYARAYYNLGIAYQELNRIDESIIAYSRATGIRPDYFEPTFNLGCLYEDLEDNNKAIQWLKRATQIVRGERAAPAYLNLGNIYRRIDDIEKAEESYREAIRFRPDYIEPRYNLGLLLKGEQDYSKALAEFKKVEALQYQPAKLYRNLGICYSNLDSLAQAAKAYQQWAKLDSSDGGAWYNLAIIYTRQADSSKAVDAYTKSLNIDSTHFQSAFNLGILYYNRNNIDSARYYYQWATKVNPSFTKAYFNLATLFSNLGEYDSAAYYYSRVTQLDPENQNAKFNLGLLYKKMGDLEMAIKTYRDIIDRDPVDYKAINNLGITFLESHEYDSAFHYFDRLVKLSNDAKAYFNRGKSLHRLDSLELAKEDYRKAIKLKPNYGSAYQNLAILEEKSGNLDEALSLIKKAIENGSITWKRYWKLGQLYAELGQRQEALKAYYDAAQFNPESSKFKREYDSLLSNP